MIGFESIAHAEDGDIALEIMDEHAFDLMITDRCPKLELLKRVRGRSAAPQSLNSIVVTALEEEYVLTARREWVYSKTLYARRSSSGFWSPCLNHQAPGFPYADVKTDFSGLTLQGDASRIPVFMMRKRSLASAIRLAFTVVSLFQLRPDMQLASKPKIKRF